MHGTNHILQLDRLQFYHHLQQFCFGSSVRFFFRMSLENKLTCDSILEETKLVLHPDWTKIAQEKMDKQESRLKTKTRTMT